MKNLFLSAVLIMSAMVCGNAQTTTDSLNGDFQAIAARNFSRYRTVNLNMEMMGSHDYKFKAGDNTLEKSHKSDLRSIRLSTMLPVWKKNGFLLYGRLQYANYNVHTSGQSSIFLEEDYHPFQGGLGSSYATSLFGRPLYLSAEVIVDGWEKGFGIVQGRMAAAMVFAHKPNTRFVVGLAGITSGRFPVVPMFSYWHSFANPDWIVDITLPSHLFLRRQIKRQRISVGAQMAVNSFYLRTSLPELPSTYFFSEVAVKPEVLYECILSKRFYVSASAGLYVPIRGALYSKSRNHRIELSGRDVKQNSSTVPFVNVSLSYRLF